MPRLRSLFALLVVVAASAAAVAPAAAKTSTDLLGGHGNFEKPAVSGDGKAFNVGATFDGWKVSKEKVSLDRGYPGLFTPPQGEQALTLDDAFTATAPPPGVVCRPIATIKNHRYTVSFLAAVGNSGTAQIVVRIGSASKSITLPNGSFPAVFEHYTMTLRATAANANFCVTSAHGGPKAYPSVDAMKVVDAGK